MKTSTRVIGGSLLLAVVAACASNKPAQGDVPAAPSAAPVQSTAGVPTAGAPSAAPAADDWAAEGGGAAGAAGTAGSAGAPVTEPPKHPSKLIMATIHGKSGSKLTGQATFSDKGGTGVKVFIEISGAKPGAHGTHIHEVGNCTAPDGSSAGDHFNPDGHDHGLPDKEARHLGDLGNITIDNDGHGTLEVLVPGANLKDIDPHSFIGRGLIVHDKKDDGSKPAGNSGKRIGCAEIK